MIKRQRTLPDGVDIPCFECAAYMKTATLNAKYSSFVQPMVEAVVHARVFKESHQAHRPCMPQPTKSYLGKP